MQLWPLWILKKIKKSNFNEYHFEPFTETLKHYRAYKRVMVLSREGINNKFLIPKVKVSFIKKIMLFYMLVVLIKLKNVWIC